VTVFPSQDPTNRIKVLKEHIEYTINRKYNKDTYKHKTQQIP